MIYRIRNRASQKTTMDEAKTAPMDKPPKILVHNDVTVRQAKSILLEIEANGGMEEANFLKICDADIPFFGEKGSDKRRKYQKVHQRMKRVYIRSIVNYCDQLKNAGIALSPQTAGKLATAEIMGYEDDGSGTEVSKKKRKRKQI